MENILLKKKKEYKNSAILVTVLLVLAIFFTNNNPKIETKTFILSKKPSFKESKTIKTANYWIELNFNGTEKIYKISDIEYKYIDKDKFVSEINENDTVQISFENDKVYKIAKSGHEYLKFTDARKHQFKLHFIVGTLYFFIISFSFWVYFLEEIPIVKIRGKEITINIDYLFIGLLVILLLVLQLTIGLDYFFNKQFMP